jgi:hypothetical protein
MEKAEHKPEKENKSEEKKKLPLSGQKTLRF